MTNPDVLAKRLLQRAHTRDGLVEILIGAFFLLLAAAMYALSVLPHRSLAFRAIVIVYAFAMPGMSFGIPKFVKWVRRRYLVEREGYVDYLPPRHLFRRQLLVGAGAVLIIGAQVALRPLPDFWVVGITGIVGGGLTAVCGAAPRFYFAGLAAAIAGVILTLAQVPMETGFAMLFGLWGGIEVISGAIAWRRFLRETDER